MGIESQSTGAARELSAQLCDVTGAEARAQRGQVPTAGWEQRGLVSGPAEHFFSPYGIHLKIHLNPSLDSISQVEDDLLAFPKTSDMFLFFLSSLYTDYVVVWRPCCSQNK